MPHCTSGLAPEIDRIDTPVVGSDVSHRPGIECCSSLVTYERRRITRPEVYIVRCRIRAGRPAQIRRYVDICRAIVWTWIARKTKERYMRIGNAG